MTSTLLRTCRKLVPPSLSLTSNLINNLTRPGLHQARSFGSEGKVQSPFDDNIIRILRTEIAYQSEYAPPDAPPVSYNSFTVENHPGEQFVRLRRNFGVNEDIKIEATMFDGCVSVPKPGDDADGENLRFHISVLVDIYKGEGGDGLGFVCSAWPDGLEIMKMYMLRGGGMPPKAYMGPHIIRDLRQPFREAIGEYLEARGVNDELAIFLHLYMAHKDRTELLRWLDTVKSFVER